MIGWEPPGYQWSEDARFSWWTDDPNHMLECLKRWQPIAAAEQQSNTHNSVPQSWRMSYSPSTRMHNYGNMITAYCAKYPSKWILRQRGPVDLSDRNKFSRIQQYLDGLSEVGLKHRLAGLISGASYAPNSVAVAASHEETAAASRGGDSVVCLRSELRSRLQSAAKQPCVNIVGARVSDIWFVKPSHPHVGSAAWITCVPASNLEHAPSQLPVGDGGTGWVYQSAVAPALSEGRKWDCRHYAIVMYDASNMVAMAYSRAFARVCVGPYSPTATKLSAQVTNISLQEELPGYSYATHEVEVAQDAVNGPLRQVVTDVARRALPGCNQHAQVGFVVLGFDTIFTPITPNAEWSPSAEGEHTRFAPVLLEVNEQPCLNANETVEGEICDKMWHDLAGIVLPLLCSTDRGTSAPLLQQASVGQNFGGFCVVHRERKQSSPLTPEEGRLREAADAAMRAHEPAFVQAYRESRSKTLSVSDSHNPKPEVVRIQAAGA